LKTKQRGSGWSIKLVFNLYKLFGYKFVYYLLCPITFFYFLFASNVRQSLKIYYARLGINFTNRVYYNHLRIFAITMVDRFITKISPKDYKFVHDDLDRLVKISSKANILIFSHFGGWASASNFSKSKNQMNIVMQETLMDSIKQVESSLGQKSSITIIDINQGAIASSISIAKALLRDELVAVMGDRTASKTGNKAIRFLGEDAYFNQNPFQIAYKMDKPMVVYFVILIGMQEYKVEFIEIEIDSSKDKDEAILKAMQKYVKSYENIVKKYPNQWFNFYDFWAK